MNIFNWLFPRNEFEKLFPLRGEVTEDILKRANRFSTSNCVGALTLKAALPEKFHKNVSWGDNKGHVNLRKFSYLVSTSENVYMIELRRTLKVTFTIKKLYY